MKRLLLLCSLFLAVRTLCHSAVILSVSPASQTVNLGSPISIGFDISGLGNGTALGTYDIDIGFDPTWLAYSSIVVGNQLNVLSLGDIQSVTPGSGTVEVFELSLDSASDIETLQASSFTLATLTFDTLATGTNSPVILSPNALGDAFGNSINAILENGSVDRATLGSDLSAVFSPESVNAFTQGVHFSEPPTAA